MAIVDLYETDHTFVQALVARAWNVTDGFNGLVVMPNNPLTGDVVDRTSGHALYSFRQPGRESTCMA